MRIALAVLVAAGVVTTPAVAETLLTTVSAPAGQVAVNPVTNKIYVASPGALGATGVAVIDAATYAKTSIDTGKRAGYVAVNAVTNKVYVSNGDVDDHGPTRNTGSDVTVIDGATNATATIAIGGTPCGIAVNAATNRVYVADSDNGRLVVIDGFTNATSTMPVGTSPCAVAVNPNTNKIYVANRQPGGGTVTVIDGATGTTATLTVGDSPSSIAIDPASNKAYVANRSSVTVIDGATDTIAATIPIVGVADLRAIVANPATHKIYVANYGNEPGVAILPGTTGNVTVIDGATNTATAIGTDVIRNPAGFALDTVTNTVYVRTGPRFGGLFAIDGDTNAFHVMPGPARSTSIALNPVTNVVYATDATNSLVHAVDANTYATTNVSVGFSPGSVIENPVTGKTYTCANNALRVIDGATDAVTNTSIACNFGLAVNPATNRIYANDGTGNILVVDGATNGVIGSLFFGGIVGTVIKVNEFTNRIYVGGTSPANIVWVFDGATNARTAILTMAGSLSDIGVNRRTNRVYVTAGGQLQVIDGATNALSTIPNGGRPMGLIGVNEMTNRIYVGNSSSSSVSVVDGASASVAALITGITSPAALAVNPVTNTVYVANNGANTLAIIDGATNAAVTKSIGAVPFAVAVDAVGNKVYISSAGSNSLIVMDGATTTTAVIPVGTQPSSVGVNPVIGKVHVANTNSSSVSIVATARTSLTNHALTLSGGNNVLTSPPSLTLNVCCAYAPSDPAGLAAYYRVGDAMGSFSAIPGTGPTFTANAVPLMPGLNFVKAFLLDRMGNGEYPGGTPLVGAPVVLPIISLAPTWTTTSPLPAATPGTSYSQALNAVGGTSTYTVTGGTPPPGLSLSSNGTISGVPTTDGFYSFTVSVSSAGGGSASRVFTITVAGSNPTRETGISTRMQVLSGDNVLIGGFVIGGSVRKTVIVRARGPSLAAAGVSGTMPNPTLQIFAGSTPIASNDDWRSATNAATVEASGFAPGDDRESAVLMALDPGLYTAIVTAADGVPGVGIVEIFELDHPEAPFIGISTRGFVQTGDNVVIGGFAIVGNAPQTVMIRARGPSLAANGVANPLADPTLTLVGNGVSITNDNWGDAPNLAAIQASGFAPGGRRESAILVTLNPGLYTAVVSGVNGTTGVGVVEIFPQ